ncbi:MAG: J domain-containing protein [Desulfovibrio sp.]|uniref:J domain-containing protein n=1 Tax=Desulfovibrio sp. TaxID=885 RepID=UPI0039E654E5
MRRRTRQISLRECYSVLKLEKDADLAAVKRAYRKRAFELHPDLNPGNAEASREFQLLNEAYVALTGILKHEDEIKKRADTRQGANKAKKENKDAKDAENARSDQQAESQSQQATSGGAAKETQGEEAGKKADAAAGENSEKKRAAQSEATASAQAEASAGARADAAGAAYAEQDVLRDLLNDPFARRVFEDIYSELNKQQTEKPQQQEPRPQTAESAPQSRAKPKPPPREKKNTTLHKDNLAWGTSKWSSDMTRNVTGIVKDWLRRQIDEEQSLTLPATNLLPGCRVRLQIRQGLQAELKTVEITLPPDFTVGKPVRLRGLGKRVGPWQGDLYLTLYTE